MRTCCACEPLDTMRNTTYEYKYWSTIGKVLQYGTVMFEQNPKVWKLIQSDSVRSPDWSQEQGLSCTSREGERGMKFISLT